MAVKPKAKPKTKAKAKAQPKAKPGRPAHEPTPQTRKLVETLAGYGIRADQIAHELKIVRSTLFVHYGAELESGVAKANAQVAESLFKKALGAGPQSVAAAIFWLKTRAHWKETVRHEHAIGGDAAPPPDDATLAEHEEHYENLRKNPE